MEKLVSILIPVYNRESLIADAINSALSQNYSNTEIVIIDNCSTDNTYEICAGYAANHQNIRLFRNDRNVGPIENFILCAEYATGAYTKYLLSDDFDSPDFLSKSVALMTEGVGFVIAGVSINSAISQWGKTTGYMSAKTYLDDVVYLGGPAGTPGNALFRTEDVREYLNKTVKLHETLCFECLGAGPDLMLLLEIANKYSQIGTIPEVLCFFGSPDDSVSVHFAEENRREYRACYHMTKMDFLTRNRGDQELKQFFAYIWLSAIKSSGKYLDVQLALEIAKVDISTNNYPLPEVADLLRVLASLIYKKMKDRIKIIFIPRVESL